MDAKLYYRQNDLTIDEEIYYIEKMMRSMEHIFSNHNHCDYNLHWRAYQNYKKRLKYLRQLQAKSTETTDDC